MSMNQTVELFSGPENPFSSVAAALGYGTFTFDPDPQSGAQLAGDARMVSADLLPQEPLIVWTAPPCEAFTNAQDWTHGMAQTDAARQAEEILGAAITLMSRLRPKWWFVETPKLEVIRKLPLMAGFNRGYPSRIRKTVIHADYGSETTGQTDIWTNAFWWQPEPLPESGGPQIAKGEVPIRRVPPPVYSEILSQLDSYQNRTADR
jgi:hypothetical protein